MVTMAQYEDPQQAHAAHSSGEEHHSSTTLDSSHGWFARLRAHYAHRSWKFFIGIGSVLLAIIMLLLPSPYVIESPGPTQNVLGESKGTPVIQVSGVPTYHDSGELLLVTVNAAGVPGYPVLNFETAVAYFSPDMMVMPQEAVFPVGQSAEEYSEESAEQMQTSQDSAVEAGLQYAQSLGVNTSTAKVTMHVDDIGGPSAGMMYALGLVDLLTPQNESNGINIAGTGTIDEQGTVGSIGGIRLKMIGARRDGAQYFLAPKANCDEVVDHVPNGLRDVQIATLDDAYNALVAIGKGQGESLPHCTV